MIVLGIDIGICGAIAMLDRATGEERVWDMPVVEREVRRKRKGKSVKAIARSVDHEGLANVLGLEALSNYAEPSDGVAYVERSYPTGQMGVSSSFNYGISFGLVVGVLAHLRIPIKFVAPLSWKRGLGLAKKGGGLTFTSEDERDKSGSLELARKLYPQLANDLALQKHDGRAEALLIAHFGAEEMGL